jgi:hypothetical protein
MSSYNTGDEAVLSNVVRLNGVDVDDPGLTLTVEDGSGNSTTYPVGSLVHDSAGNYHITLVLTTAGVWRWEWTTTGGNSGSSAGFFLVGTDPFRFAPWTTPQAVLATSAMGNVTVDDDDPILRDSCDGATEYLVDRTWKKYQGLREVELRPCCGHAYSRMSAWLAWPMISASIGRSSSPDPIPVIEGPSDCGCNQFAQIVLPDDVRVVTSVLIDGTAFTDWRVDSGRRLTRTDLQSWPCCANVQIPETEDNTFSVHVVVGTEVPTLGGLAAAELAAELYLATADPSACRIPTRVSTMQRQGATYTRVDTATLGKDGMLGLRITDIFLSQFGKRRRTIQIASPDTPERARRVGPGPY